MRITRIINKMSFRRFGRWPVGVLAGLFLVLAARPMFARFLGNLGMIYFVQLRVEDCKDCADLQKAKDVLERAVHLDPGLARLHEQLGQVYLWEGQVAEAQQELSASLKLAKGDPRTWAQLGDAYDRLGQPEKAVEAYRQAGIQANHGRYEVNLLLLARAQIHSGKVNAARLSLQEAVRLNPDSLWAWKTLAEAPVGPDQNAQDKTRRYQIPHLTDERQAQFWALAAKDLIASHTWTPAEGVTLAYLFLIHSWTSPTQVVLAAVEEQTPGDLRLVGLQARLAAVLGNPTQAAARWEELAHRVTGQPAVLPEVVGSSAAWFEAGEAWGQAGKTQAAIAAYRSSLALDPQNDLAWQALLDACRMAADTPCQTEAEARLSEFSIVRRIKSVLHSSRPVQLGPGLMHNGDLVLRQPGQSWLGSDWSLFVWRGLKNDLAGFYNDIDERAFAGQPATLQLGFWRLPTEIKVDGYNELETPHVNIPAGGIYVFSFYYRTDLVEGKVFLQDGYTTDATFGGDILAPTGGAWKHVLILAQNQKSMERIIRPQLRLWGLGAAWFSHLQVQFLQSSLPTGVNLPIWIR